MNTAASIAARNKPERADYMHSLIYLVIVQAWQHVAMRQQPKYLSGRARQLCTNLDGEAGSGEQGDDAGGVEDERRNCSALSR